MRVLGWPASLAKRRAWSYDLNGVENEILMEVFFAPHGVVGASAWPTGCFASSPFSAAAAGVGATEACSALILQRQPAFAFSLRLCVAQCPTGWRRTP